MRRIISRVNWELAAWVAGLAYLAMVRPHAGLPDFCVFRWMGLERCPGCGLGAAVSHLLHGELRESWERHWLGVPALVVLLMRIVQLIKLQFMPIIPVK